MDFLQKAETELQIKSLDFERLRAIQEFDDAENSLLLSVIDLYIDIGPKTLVKIKTAVEGADTLTVHRSVHELKSSSSNIGAAGLAGLCQTLENQTDPELKHEKPDLAASFAKLEAELTTVLQDFKKLRDIVKGTI